MRAKKRRAALAVELLLALPVLLAVLLATVEFSVFLSARQQVTSAAREAARVAALGGSADDVQTSVARFLGPNVAEIQSKLTDDNGDPLPVGDPVTVVVTVPTFKMVPELLGFIGFSLRGTEISARAVMRKE
ncbi:MAG: pilus assembly protein [Gemmataceae bacterium]|nr:pilus assembly protein [Gemmataceae bacterium]